MAPDDKLVKALVTRPVSRPTIEKHFAAVTVI